MQLQGFEKKDFDTFYIDGLDERMKAIQERIQPKFKVIGTELTDHLSVKLGQEMFLHIAKHARRSVNPPNDTWLAICENKRGYKKHPHFQLGLFDDHIFVWLAFIYELPGKDKIATQFLSDIDKLQSLPNSFVVSLDHTKKDAISIQELSSEHLNRVRTVKKAELLIGKHISKETAIELDTEVFINDVKETFDTLVPLYQKAMHVL
ncbi:YktB family protein [Paraliobacillus sp. JSM ZJ581]|uniref:YktB family protein n=1 Tax=Paraliobacillus sp. JSM ZJ581 TaxID=3342118 RepID=UPI0035A84405